MVKGEWVITVSGVWRLVGNWKMGGTRFDVFVPGIGWTVADGEPRRHIVRRMVRRSLPVMLACRAAAGL